MLTLKVPNTNAADDILMGFFFFFSEKISLDILCESSAWKMIHIKCIDIFSLKKKIRM